MTIAAVLLFAWSAVCWFSGAFPSPFLGLPLFAVDPLIPLALSLTVAAVGVVIWSIRRGPARIGEARRWLDEHRGIVIALAGILLLHILIQLPAVIFVQGAHDADSALYGIAGYGIADGHIRPLYNLGKYHMGSFVPHVTAVFNAAFGKSPYYMRIVLTAFYLGFIICLFLLMRRLFGDGAALLAALLAAIPTRELFQFLKHQENATTLFLGTLALLIANGITGEKRDSLTRYFMLGLVLGIGVWTNYQFVYFVLAVALILFIGDKTFFLRPKPWATVAGMVTGGLPIIIMASKTNLGPFIEFITAPPTTGTGSWADLPVKAGSLFVHIPTLLGLTLTPRVRQGLAGHTFAPWVTWTFVALFAACFVLYLWQSRKDIGAVLRGRNTSAGRALPLVFAFALFLVFTLSSYSGIGSPMRYVLPLWIAVVIVVAVGLRWVMAHWRWLGVTTTVLFCALFFISNLMETRVILQRERIHKQWLSILRDRNISVFYGPWLRAYWTSFVTAERVVGTASFPMEWNPYPHYQEVVDDSTEPIGYLFEEHDTYTARFMKQRLAAVGVTWEETDTPFGALYYGFSQRFIAGQLVTLEPRSYAATIESHRMRQCGTPGLHMLELTVRNAGQAEWYANASTGHVEMIVLSGSGREIRRQPLTTNVAPGERAPWSILLDADESEEGPVQCLLAVNGFRLTNTTILPADGPESPSGSEEEPVRVCSISTGEDLIHRQELFADGWGAFIQGNRAEYRWSSGNMSTLLIPLDESRDLRLMMNLAPYRGDTMPPETDQTLTIGLNGNELVPAITLSKSRVLTIELPGDKLHPGLNRLTLTYGAVEPRYNPTGQYRDPRFRIRPKAISLREILIK